MKYLIFIFLTAVYGNDALAQAIDNIETEVAKVERAFAKTMADRNFGAFSSFLADDTVFWNNGSALRGKQAVMNVWQAYYDNEAAPFKWEPETVMLIKGGNLALSTGPVSDESSIFMYYTSVWRKEADGNWKIILDKGQKYCEKCAGE